MKRLLLVGLVLLFTGLLVGCGNKAAGGGVPSPSAEPLPVADTNPNPALAPVPDPGQKEPPGVLNPLTGEMVSRTGKLVAVMVDNLAAARPQTGLTDADLVYEIEAEGQITRLMAIFYGDPPESVGPVRSARPYFLALAREWDAYYAHVGGSQDALEMIERERIPDIDDMKGHSGFRVDGTRQRPHSTYLDLEKALANRAGNGRFPDWQFIDPPGGVPDYRQIRISYLDNQVKYVFDEERQVYLRYMLDKPHADRVTGEQITARNIIIQYAVHRNLRDKLKHIDVEVIGKGQAEYFLGGKYQKGTWKKTDDAAHTVFLGEDGTPVQMVRGNTFIQVVRSSGMVSKEGGRS